MTDLGRQPTPRLDRFEDVLDLSACLHAATHPPTIEERVIAFRNRLVHYPAFTEALAAIERCHRMGRHSMDEPSCLLVIGVSGCGKSTLRREYGRRFPRYELDDRTAIPVLHLELPAQPTIKNVAERILLELGDPFAEKGSAEGKTARIIVLMRACGVQLVILDEFQHFVDNAGNKVESRVADWLKHLINSTRVPFVLMGLPRCQRILAVNEQLRRRFSPKLVLAPFALRDITSRKQFAGIMRSLQEQIPLADASMLTDPDTMRLFFYATYGLIDYIVKLVAEALHVALARQAASIDREILEASFTRAIWAEGVGARNPFHVDFDTRPLTKEGEPFYGYGG